MHHQLNPNIHFVQCSIRSASALELASPPLTFPNFTHEGKAGHGEAQCVTVCLRELLQQLQSQCTPLAVFIYWR